MRKKKSNEFETPRDDGAGKPEPSIGVLKRLNEEEPEEIFSSLTCRVYELRWKEIHVNNMSAEVLARTRVEALERFEKYPTNYPTKKFSTRIIKSGIKTGKGRSVS